MYRSSCGILGSDIPSSGADLASIMYAQLALPGDAAHEWAYWVESSTLPSGFFPLADDGSGTRGPYADGRYAASIGLYRNDARQYAYPLTLTVGTYDPPVLSDPSDFSATPGDVATFSVAPVTGRSPITLQWRRNGSNVTGETAESITTEALDMADDGDVFDCVATNVYGSTTSAEAMLTVSEVPTLIVEDGTARADAESYISAADATTYHAARGNTAWTALSLSAKEQALRKATDYMVQVYSLQWAGIRHTTTQALDWPRDNVLVLSMGASFGTIYYPNNIVPVEVQRACAELALRSLTAELAPDVGRQVVRQKIDVIDTEYSTYAQPFTRYRAVDNTLAKFFGGSSAGSTIALSRA